MTGPCACSASAPAQQLGVAVELPAGQQDVVLGARRGAIELAVVVVAVDQQTDLVDGGDAECVQRGVQDARHTDVLAEAARRGTPCRHTRADDVFFC